MPLTPEEVADLKAQLLSQIQHLPEDKREIAKRQIDEMSAETLEYMLKQQSAPQKGKTIFRMIAEKQTESNYVGENKKAIAVLDINPISKGHTIVIPKSPVKDSKNLPNAVFTLAKSISKRIVKQLGAKNAELHSENNLGECIIHILPIYDSPLHLGSPRQKATKEELDQIAAKISLKKRQRIQKIKKISSPLQFQITKRRIP